MSPAHFGGGVHSGPSPSFPGPSHSFTPPSMTHYPPVQASQARHWPYGNPAHGPNDGRGGAENRRHYPYVYAGYPWLNSFGYGLPLAYGSPYGDEQEDAGGPQPAPQQAEEPVIDYGREPAGPQVAANAPPPFRPAYQAPPEVAPLYAQPATTLIFKDGRPSTQVHNYALTGSTLYALDGESRQEIPLSLLNVPATVEANRAAGVDFALPVSR